MFLNFGFNVVVRSGHHRHPNIVEAAELLQECIHFFGPLCIFIYIYIQGDSGGICNTLGNDSMCDSKQESSYEHGSDFERLPRYGKKNIRTILRARTTIT